MIFYGFLILIFSRPFISSTAYPEVNFLHTISLFVICIFLIFTKRADLAPLKKVKIPILLFMAAIISSCLFSQDKRLSFIESYRYAFGLLLFFIGFSLSKDEKTQITTILFYGGILVSFLALYQYAFGFKHLQAYIAHHHINDEFVKDYIEKKRVSWPFFSPNMLAGYLAMVAPLGFAQKKAKWFLVPMLSAILLTQSLGGFASIIVSACIIFCLIRTSKIKKTVLLLALGIGITAVFWVRMTDSAIFRQPGSSIRMRSQYWLETISFIKDHPIKGTGIGLFDITSARHTHNVFLEIWAEAGILAVCSFIMLAGYLFWLTKRKITSGSFHPLLLPVFSGVLVFLIHNFIDFSFFFPETVFIWWLLAGLLASLASTKHGY
jgi:O-antigen ligase